MDTLEPSDTLTRLLIADYLAEMATEPVDLKAALAVLDSTLRRGLPKAIEDTTTIGLIQRVTDMVAIKVMELEM